MSSLLRGTLQIILTLLCLLHSARSNQVEVQEPLEELSKTPSKALNVLFVSIPAWGHVNPLLTVAEELVIRGHRVTMCVGSEDESGNAFKKKIEERGITHCSFYSNVSTEMNELAERRERDDGTWMSVLSSMLAQYSAELMAHVSPLISNHSFDIMVGEECTVCAMRCINSLWSIPTVFVGTSMEALVHLHPQWSWPGLLLGSSSDDLSFSQRVLSTIEKFFFPVFLDYIFFSSYKSSLQGFCPDVSLSDFSSSAGITIPYIVPSVIGLEYARTQAPMVEYVGPLQSRSPAPLSKEMAEWLSSKPEHSVVYISTGSMFNLNKENGKAFLEGVVLTNCSLLWSLRKSNQWILEGLEIDPDRVLVSEWTPQQRLLGSMAIHSAILHGGYNGLSDALSNGVPVIGFPLMEEQTLNMGRVHHNKLGLLLSINEALSSTAIKNAVMTVSSEDYRRNTKKLQKMCKFAGGAKRAADLIEYYEEMGYEHLVPAFIKYDWTTVQYYNIDVFVLFLVVFALIAAGCLLSLRFVISKCLKRKAKTD